MKNSLFFSMNWDKKNYVLVIFAAMFSQYFTFFTVWILFSKLEAVSFYICKPQFENTVIQYFT